MGSDLRDLAIGCGRVLVFPMPSRTLALEVAARAGSGALKLTLAETVLSERDDPRGELTPSTAMAFSLEPLPSPTLVWSTYYEELALLVEERISVDGDSLSWRATFTNRSARVLPLRWRQKVAGIPMSMRFFAPSAASHYSITDRDVVVGYRDGGGELSMPLVAIHSTEPDVGAAFLSSFEGLVEPFLATLRRVGDAAELVTDRRIVGLRPAESRTVRSFVVGHDGCWRPALAWARERFRRFFYLPDSTLHATQGCFIYSTAVSEMKLHRWAEEGTKQVEIHMMYSHLGKYVPLEEPWLRMADDRWSAVKRTTDPHAPEEDAPYESIKGYLHTVCEPATTRETVRRFIRRAHRLGLKCYNYFQPTESWEFFADDFFPEAILRESDGSPRLTWYDHVQMDCSPETRWGQYLIEQLEGVLAMYPELDGVFMDQAAEDDATYRVKRITDALACIVESRGKWCWWNGPYLVELIEHAIGMLAEGGSIQGETLKYLVIGDKGACGMGTLERQYQRNLVNGLWPSAPSMSSLLPLRESDDKAYDAPVDPRLAELHERYLPLFRLFRGRVWVLEPRPLELPDYLQGNVFQRPNGDYLVTLIDPSHSRDRPVFRWDVPVTIRVSGAHRVKAVYGITPDCPGRFSVPFARGRHAIMVRIPRLRSALLLHLPVEGVHVSAVGEWARQEGSKDPAVLAVDNWDAQPRTVSVTARRKTFTRRLAPGKSLRIRMSCPHVNRAKNLWELPCASTIGGQTERHLFSWFVERPVDLSWQGYLAVVAGSSSDAFLTIGNRSAAPKRIDLRCHAGGTNITGLPASVTLDPGERRTLSLMITAKAPGETEITIVAFEGGRERARITDSLHCWKANLGVAGLVPAFGGYIQLTGWMPEGSNHGTEWGLVTKAPLPPVPVRTAYLNGKLLGRVNTRNYRRWHPLYTIAIPSEVVPYLASVNELIIEPAGPMDFFKVKDTRMNVVLADGQILSTPPVRQVYSSCAHELAEGIVGAPIRIELAFSR